MSLFDEAKSSADIVSVIGADISIRRAGSVFVGLCPFHEEANPSFTIYPDSQSYYCWGCGSSGTVLDYVSVRDGLSLADAARSLLDGRHPRPALYKVRESVPVAIPAEILRYWHLRLRDRSYLYNRGFTDSTIDRMQFGFDGRRYTIPVWEGPPGESFVYQVARRRHDQLEMRRLRGEMPDADEDALHDAMPPKYLNVPGHPGHRLFGKWTLKGKQDIAFVFAGLFTVASAIQDGFEVASPSNGVGSWQDEWAQHFSMYARVYVIQDREGNERDAAHMIAASIGGHARVLLSPPGGDDYNSFRASGGTVVQFRDYVARLGQ